MAIIKKLKDNNGNTVYPMSTLESIFVSNNFTLKELLQKLQIWNLSNDYTYEYDAKYPVENLVLDLFSKNKNEFIDLQEGNNIISIQIPEAEYDTIKLHSNGVIVAEIQHGSEYRPLSKGTYILQINCDKNNMSPDDVDSYYYIESYKILHQIN